MKLLVIEDNQRLAERVRNRMRSTYVVDVAHSAEEGLNLLRSSEYNVVVLDLGLPDLSGLTVCRQARAAGVSTPIIILTGEYEMDIRLALFDAGADDFVTKPFNTDELQARINAHARRHHHSSESLSELAVGDLTLNSGRREVYRDGTRISLRRKEFDILEYLLNNKGRVLTREMILNHAWESNKDSWNSTVDVHIKHLRDKIDRPFKRPLIKTVYGLGYRVDNPE